MNIETSLEQIQKDVAEVKGDVRDIRLVLKGYDGQQGLLQSYTKLAQDFYRFKRNCYVVGGFLVGTGVLGTAIWQVAKIL